MEKVFNLTALLLMLAAVAVLAPPAAADDDSNPWYSTYKTMTCSGDEARTGQTQAYFFGFTRDDGFCATKLFSANSYNEAWDCAQSFCKDCKITDLTGSFSFGTGVPGIDLTRGFCPVK